MFYTKGTTVALAKVLQLVGLSRALSREQTQTIRLRVGNFQIRFAAKWVLRLSPAYLSYGSSKTVAATR